MRLECERGGSDVSLAPGFSPVVMRWSARQRVLATRPKLPMMNHMNLRTIPSLSLALGFTAFAALAVEPVAEMRVYKKVGDRELHLHIEKPAAWKATDRRPAIVFFFGGGWVGGSPGQFQGQSEYLAT